jgi:hypothetical protein
MDRFYMRVARGCDYGSSVTVQPPGAAETSSLVTEHGKPVLVAIQPRASEFNIILTRHDGSKDTVLIKVSP